MYSQQEEIDIFLEYNPRNDTYLILRPDGGYFSEEGHPEVFRRWGKSQIYVGYNGKYIIRFESHPIPCTLRITSNSSNALCPQLDRIPVTRLVADCWLDDFAPNAVVGHISSGKKYPNAASNLRIDRHELLSHKIYRPEDYDVL